jgi:hypothetical protein
MKRQVIMKILKSAALLLLTQIAVPQFALTEESHGHKHHAAGGTLTDHEGAWQCVLMTTQGRSSILLITKPKKATAHLLTTSFNMAPISPWFGGFNERLLISPICKQHC